MNALFPIRFTVIGPDDPCAAAARGKKETERNAATDRTVQRLKVMFQLRPSVIAD